MEFRIPFRPRPPRVNVIRLQGMISASPRGGGLSDAGIGPVIDRAFRRGKPVAVALIVNSPGGSPAQSALIAARVRRLSDDSGVPVHAFVEDVAASGGYWLATAADHIWADASSIVGSIGVISASFGLSDFIARYGIERRVHTAGGSKSFMDPFKPERPADVARLKALQEPIHQAFITQVQSRRGARLSADADLFTGEVWVGQQAVTVGLIDGIAHLEPKMRALYGDAVRFVRHGQRRSVFQRFGLHLAQSLTGSVLDTVEERATLARYGL